VLFVDTPSPFLGLVGLKIFAAFFKTAFRLELGFAGAV